MYIKQDVYFLPYDRFKEVIPVYDILPALHTLIVLFKSPKQPIQYNSGYRIYSIPKNCDRVIYTKVDPVVHLTTISEIWNTSKKEELFVAEGKINNDSDFYEDYRPVKHWIIFDCTHPERVIGEYRCKTITSAEAYFKKEFHFEFSSLLDKGLLRIKSI